MREFREVDFLHSLNPVPDGMVIRIQGNIMIWAYGPISQVDDDLRRFANHMFSVLTTWEIALTRILLEDVIDDQS